jgi:hypothetical protein
MLLFLLPIGVGAVVAKIRGARLSDATRVPVRAPALVFVALALQVALPRVPPSGRAAVVLLSYVAVGVWTVVNLARRPPAVRIAFGLIALGWSMNVLAIAPHGAMPVSPTALAAVGAPASFDVETGNLSKHVLADSTSALRWLGDTIPVPPLRTVISLGDIALAAGIVLLLSSAATCAGGTSPRKEVIAP